MGEEGMKETKEREEYDHISKDGHGKTIIIWSSSKCVCYFGNSHQRRCPLATGRLTVQHLRDAKEHARNREHQRLAFVPRKYQQ